MRVQVPPSAPIFSRRTALSADKTLAVTSPARKSRLTWADLQLFSRSAIDAPLTGRAARRSDGAPWIFRYTEATSYLTDRQWLSMRTRR